MQTVKLEEFDEFFADMKAKNLKAVVLFSSTQDAEGTYWCPDCQDILPFYPDFTKECQENKIPFFVFIAGDRPTWKDANHKFRKMPEIAISGIPTMGLFDGKKVTRKLEGQEIAKKANRDMLFEL